MTGFITVSLAHLRSLSKVGLAIAVLNRLLELVRTRFCAPPNQHGSPHVGPKQRTVVLDRAPLHFHVNLKLRGAPLGGLVLVVGALADEVQSAPHHEDAFDLRCLPAAVIQVLPSQQKDHIDIRILQTMASRIPQVLGFFRTMFVWPWGLLM